MLLFFRWQDIVVGAPQYFEKDGEIGGAVYVYINKAGNWKKVKPTRIDGPRDSMFGLAVENLGDINQDGYHGEAAVIVHVHICMLQNVSPSAGHSQCCITTLFFFFVTDFAVGAPYEEDGAGNVYIFHGSATGLKSKKAPQVRDKLVELVRQVWKMCFFSMYNVYIEEI